MYASQPLPSSQTLHMCPLLRKPSSDVSTSPTLSFPSPLLLHPPNHVHTPQNAVSQPKDRHNGRGGKDADNKAGHGMPGRRCEMSASWERGREKPRVGPSPGWSLGRTASCLGSFAGYPRARVVPGLTESPSSAHPGTTAHAPVPTARHGMAPWAPRGQSQQGLLHPGAPKPTAVEGSFPGLPSSPGWTRACLATIPSGLPYTPAVSRGGG
ncbi:hypothetical protein HJG60_011916 [Phyllostomus discolor]|uniref:Uncharacterized protein n=1 Tax=Phyllostomus discolor TaxID=89673 RepID=A0A834DW29_9CHIR|nr:hypothetical protein HJG60_011916 [Phyllostomus discolor]